MKGMLRWCACAGMAGSLALSACAGTRPAAGDAPALRFVPSADEGLDANRDGSARTRRDVHGRPIRFREQRLDRHGVMRDVEAGRAVPQDSGASGHGGEADCVDHERCRRDDRARGGGGQRGDGR